MNWRALAGVVLFLGIVGVVTVGLLYGLTGGDYPFDHAIVVDAGSSKSELFLYRWRGDKDNGTGCVTEQKASCKVKEKGLSGYDTSVMAAESLKGCLDNLYNRIPEEKRSSSPVYLGATAGMRLSNITDHNKNVATFELVRCLIDKKGLNAKDIGIISGSSEGLYAWVQANFLLQNLQRKTHGTLGALDMGGASTQISFEVPTEYSNQPNVNPLKLYGEAYHVFSVSYLCFGMNELHRRYLAIITGNPNKNSDVFDPCALKGYENPNVTADYLFNQPCTTTEEWKKWVDTNPEKLNKTYTIRGTGIASECKAKMNDLFSCSQNTQFRDCFKPIDPLIQLDKVMAFSSFFYTTDFFKATNSINVTLTEFKEKVDKYCGMDWDTAKVEYKNISDDAKKTLDRYCFQGHSIQYILNTGYHFNESTWSNIDFRRTIGKEDAGWALGYMINATNAIPAEDPNKPVIHIALFVIVLLICTVLITLFFVFLKRHKTVKESGIPA